MAPVDRHAILADPSRRAILDVLHDAGAPLDVGTIATRVGLHPNSVRDHLHRLRDTGMIRVSTAAPAGRGRPGLRYELAPALLGGVDPWKAFAAAIADQVAARPDADALWLSAGVRWGQAAADAAVLSPAGASADTPADAVATVTEILREAGFEPEARVVADGELELRLSACPFLPVERHRLPVICGVHHGFLQGVLRGLGSPLEARVLQPFAEPRVCIARLAGPISDPTPTEAPT